MSEEPIDLNKRKAANALAMSLGAYGMAWVLEVCAEVYDGITDLYDTDWDQADDAKFRARFLREIKRSFE